MPLMTRSVVTELDEADALDEGLTPGGEIVSEELIVQVIPQGKGELTCYSCFLVRPRFPTGAREQPPFPLRRVRGLRRLSSTAAPRPAASKVQFLPLAEVVTVG
nr:DUF4193 family protein [Arthrobacter globiformis]